MLLEIYLYWCSTKNNKVGFGNCHSDAPLHLSNIAPSGAWSGSHGIRIGGKFSDGNKNPEYKHAWIHHLMSLKVRNNKNG